MASMRTLECQYAALREALIDPLLDNGTVLR